MDKRPLGLSDVKITPIIMGTWQAGKKMWVGIEDEESIQAIRAAYEAGITTIDTAEVYGEGHSERIVAKALADVRARVVYASKVFSKVFANHLKYDLVIEACDRSLKNLDTDYIDLYQIHWPAARHQCSLAQLSLAWLIAQPQTNAIAGARNAEQAMANAKAAEVRLSEAELHQIDQIGRQVSDYLDSDPVMWNW
ncbi:aldo/keto reductase [Pleurocapsales cyanobacterium LEGE 06147]|nr:aldo/keto reductase [Pleurocapsales cyanobacterium LEGE 06147]